MLMDIVVGFDVGVAADDLTVAVLSGDMVPVLVGVGVEDAVAVDATVKGVPVGVGLLPGSVGVAEETGEIVDVGLVASVGEGVTVGVTPEVSGVLSGVGSVRSETVVAVGVISIVGSTAESSMSRPGVGDENTPTSGFGCTIVSTSRYQTEPLGGALPQPK